MARFTQGKLSAQYYNCRSVGFRYVMPIELQSKFGLKKGTVDSETSHSVEMNLSLYL